MQPTLPPDTERLFPDALPGAGERSFLFGRLLEDGDGADLRWLFASVPEEAAAAWLRERGGRQLSARSRAFWEVVLGVAAGPASEIARELWPL